MGRRKTVSARIQLVMRNACAACLLAIMSLAGSLPVSAQTIREFPCQIDLTQIEVDNAGQVVPPEFRTTFGTAQQQKNCQGTSNVRIICETLIDDWPFNDNFVVDGFPCRLNPLECGITNVQVDEDGLAAAAVSNLTVVAARSNRCSPGSTSCGLATLQCRLR